MRALLATALLLLPAVAQAQVQNYRYDPAVAWFDAPNTTDLGDARMRIVFDGREGAAALTPNQYWAYSEAYRRTLAGLSLRMPVDAAIPRARHEAFLAVARANPKLVVQGFALSELMGGRTRPTNPFR